MFMKKRWPFILLLVAVFLVITSLPMYAEDPVILARSRGGRDISTLDPAHMIGNEENNVILAIFSRLIKIKPGTSEWELDAAEEFTISDDGRVISFKLREGIQFHHGYGEMTAEDVRFSYERIIDPEVQSEYRDDFAVLNRVEVTGRYSGKLIMDEPFPGLLTRTLPMTTGSILSKKAFEELGKERFATNPIGSGAYYFKEWQPNQRIVLERFDGYFGDRPDFKRILLFPIADEKVAELSFERGDLNETRISLDSIERYLKDPQVDIETLTILGIDWIGFNHHHPPFNDLRVREALRYAINVDEIIIGAYNDVPKKARAMIAPGILGYWEDAPDYYDIDRAKELLEEAGYPEGFTTEMAVYGRPTDQNVALIAQHQLRRVGINVQIKIMDPGEAFGYLGKQSTPGMHFMSFAMVLDPGYWTEWFTTSQVGQWNYLKWSNPEFDALHQEANITMDSKKRNDMYIRMQQLMHEDAVAIWITNGAAVHASKDTIQPVYFAQYSLYDAWKVKD